MNIRFSTVVLILATLVLGTLLGVGIYEALFTMPAWFASPPGSFALIGLQNSRTATTFWIPLQLIFLLSMVVGLLLNWRFRVRRKLLFFVMGAYALVAISSGAYFVPELVAFSGLAPTGVASPELAARASRWLTLSWGRHLLLLSAQVALLLALAHPAKVPNISEVVD